MAEKANKWSVALVHAIPGVIPTIDKLARDTFRGVTIFNLLHEGLFLEIMRTGKISPAVIKGISDVVVAAESAGASLVLVTGSTFSPAIDVARKLVSIPVLKIDEAMAEEVVKKGRSIALIATEEATVAPSSRIILEKAAQAGVVVKIQTAACPEARLHYREGNIQLHDTIIKEAIDKFQGQVDCIVLAQASMYSVVSSLPSNLSTPVYASPELAIRFAHGVLRSQGWNEGE